jgi:hypothetical protein
MAGFARNMDYPIAAIDQHQRTSVEHKQMRGRILSRLLLAQSGHPKTRIALRFLGRKLAVMAFLPLRVAFLSSPALRPVILGKRSRGRRRRRSSKRSDLDF